MSDAAFEVRHGSLEDVVGRPHSHEGITFVPALVKLNGSWLQSTCDLVDFTAGLSSSTTEIVMPGTDAPWVFGRLMWLFNSVIVPEEDRFEKCCFYEAFVAVLPGDVRIAIPFECKDYYGKSALTFSTDDPPAEETQELIANAFWGLLLSTPEDVSDYEDKMFHSGAGVWIRFGVSNGEPFFIEELDGE